MKIVVIKLKTTHINPELATILEFCAVGFNTKDEDFNPKIYRKRFVPDDKSLVTSIKAITMNSDLFEEALAIRENQVIDEEILKLYNCVIDSLIDDFFNWLNLFDLLIANTEYQINVAGKNFANYDRRILVKLDSRFDMLFKHRSLDLATLYCSSSDDVIPDLLTCKIKSGLFSPMEVKDLSEPSMDIAKMLYHTIKSR